MNKAFGDRRGARRLLACPPPSILHLCKLNSKNAQSDDVRRWLHFYPVSASNRPQLGPGFSEDAARQTWTTGGVSVTECRPTYLVWHSVEKPSSPVAHVHKLQPVPSPLDPSSSRPLQGLIPILRSGSTASEDVKSTTLVDVQFAKRRHVNRKATQTAFVVETPPSRSVTLHLRINSQLRMWKINRQ